MKPKQIREALRMTQKQMAEAIGVTVLTLSRWENGHFKPSRLAQKILADLEARATRTKALHKS